MKGAEPLTTPLFASLTDDAIARMATAEPRLREVMTILLRHIHDAVREARVTEQEWALAIEFLTRTGKMCAGNRQEFILLSDVLGISMLIDAINHGADGDASESTVLGPFYAGRQPTSLIGSSILKRHEPGELMTMEGRIADCDASPLAGALIEVWQTAPNGLYDVQDPAQPQGHLRATFQTDESGAYRFETVTPVSYAIPDDGPVGRLLDQMGRHPNRPSHIHFMITAPGYRRLVTHLFIAGDPYLHSDAVFGVKDSLIVAPVLDGEGRRLVRYDFKLVRNG
jgi:protocatechuate 3,4-dioxygenase beta subunit